MSHRRILLLPYHPDGVIEKYKKKSSWRKPDTGMLEEIKKLAFRKTKYANDW